MKSSLTTKFLDAPTRLPTDDFELLDPRCLYDIDELIPDHRQQFGQNGEQKIE